MQTSNNEGKKVLLRVSNLKQYFPLKKKGLYVKANDGITLDIYEARPSVWSARAAAASPRWAARCSSSCRASLRACRSSCS